MTASMEYRSRDKACCRLVVLMTVLLALVTGCERYGDMLSQPRRTLQSEIWSIRVAPDGRKAVLQARLVVDCWPEMNYNVSVVSKLLRIRRVTYAQDRSRLGFVS